MSEECRFKSGCQTVKTLREAVKEWIVSVTPSVWNNEETVELHSSDFDKLEKAVNDV